MKSIWKFKQSYSKNFHLIVLVLETSNIVDSDENLLAVLKVLKKTTQSVPDKEEKFSLNIICNLFLGETKVVFPKQLTENSPDIAWKNFRQLLDRKATGRGIDGLFQRAIDHAQQICSSSTDTSKLECCGILIMALLTEDEELSVVPFDDEKKNLLEAINNTQFQGEKLILLVTNRSGGARS